MKTGLPNPREVSSDSFEGAIPGHSALLRASGVRFSFLSIPELFQNEGHAKKWGKPLLAILSADKNLLRKAAASFLVQPFLVVPLMILGILSRLKGPVGMHAQWYLTYGSSIGYLRLMWLSLRGRLSRLAKESH